MDLLGRIDAVRRRNTELAYPVGPVVVEAFDKAYGHRDEQFSPESYGDYLVTSNEVFSAAMLRSRLVGTVPIRSYRGRDQDKRELPDSRPARLLRHVNPFWTQARLARMDELCACLWGQSVWAVEKDELGIPREIWWLKPSRVLPVPDEENYLAGYKYESNVDGRVLEFDADEIVWFRYPNPLDEYSALSPISAARLAADTGSAMMKANRNLHDKGLQIAGMVMPKAHGPGQVARFTQPQADELQERLEKRFSGADKAHRWAVLRYEAEFKPVNVTPKDAEFINGLQLSLRQVCNAYGIPAPLLNDLEHATLANIREFQKGLWEHALVPDLELRGQEIEEQFLPMFGRARGRTMPDHVEHDFSGVAALQESQSAVWDRERQAIEVGALTINEWRQRRGMPPVPWGDVWWGPVNKAAVEDENSTPNDNPDTPNRQAWHEQQQLTRGFNDVLAALEWDFAGVNGHGGL
ncbi:phage portal protein [Prauserella muralis]|uniref:Phage portal protein n=1 Tax=Prauserella muralis TaxID=588067 RepID=A0A2V4AM72_9PSEU|nr:phage portal protein [Prauserella muralis]PXY21133.1 phage portal protein [Prauserella muralis]TWE30221.1 HK97 family phage portal protein [Prauserella muralis]